MEDNDLRSMKAKEKPMDTAELPAVTSTEAPNKGGAPLGNRNRMTWGGRGWAAIGSYPKGFSAVRRYVGRMRAELEGIVCERHGEVSALHAALIQSACRHEGRALHLQRRLRVGIGPGGLGLNDELAVLKEIGNATDSRDKCLSKLGLEKPADPAPAWPTFDAAPAAGEPTDGT
jgi:hypothetical protein